MTDHTITQDEIDNHNYNSLSDLIKGLGGGSYNLNITSEINITKNFTIDQTLNINAGGGTLNIGIGGSCTLNIDAGGTLNIDGGTLNIGIGGGGTLNIGIGGGGTLNIDADGTLNIDGGTLNIDVGGGGTLNINAGGTLNIDGGTLNINAGGTLNIDAGGTLNIDGGTLNIDAGGTLNIDGGTLNIDGGTLLIGDRKINYDKIIYIKGQIIRTKGLDKIIMKPETKDLQEKNDIYNSVLSSFGVSNPSVNSSSEYNEALFKQFKDLLDSELSDIEASDTIWPKQAITCQILKLKKLLLLLLSESYNQQSKIQNNDLLKLMYKV